MHSQSANWYEYISALRAADGGDIQPLLAFAQN
jgi:hypothetical protein